MRNNTRIRAVLLLILLCCGLIPIPTDGQSQEIIKIGGVFPLSGELALGGRDRATAFKMAIDQINANPSLLSHHKLEGIIADSATDPETGELVARDLINQGAVGLIGASSSSVTQAIAAGPSKDNEVPQISYSSTSPVLSDSEQFPYLLRVVPSDSLQTRALAETVSHYDFHIISILKSANLYSQGVSNVEGESSNSINLGVSSLAEEVERLNIRVIENREIQSAADIRRNLEAIRDFGSNIILLNLYLQDAIDLFSIAYDLDMTSEQGYVWIGSDASSQLEILKANEKSQQAMQGMLGLRPQQPDGVAYDQFIQLWNECAGTNSSYYPGCGDTEPNFYAPFSYDATYILARAIHDAIEQDIDYQNGAMLYDILLDTSYSGVTGQITFNPQGDRIGGYDVVNIQGDNFATVGQWNPDTGFEQIQPVQWDGEHTGPQPYARLGSSWILFVTVVIGLPVLIYSIRVLGNKIFRRST